MLSVLVAIRTGVPIASVVAIVFFVVITIEVFVGVKDVN